MKLLEEAKRTGYDGMRILVAKTNLPAVSLYRRTGARYCGDVFPTTSTGSVMNSSSDSRTVYSLKNYERNRYEILIRYS